MAKQNNAATASARDKWFEHNKNFLKDVKEPFWGDIHGFLPRVIAFIPLLIKWIIKLFAKKSIKPEEFDKRVAVSAEIAKKRVFNALGIDPSQVKEAKPIMTLSDVQSDLYREDKKLNKHWTDKYEVLFVLFGRDELFIYSYTFSMIEDDIWEITGEYFYRDIVSVSVVRSKSVEKKDENGNDSGTKSIFKKFKQAVVTETTFFNSFQFITAGGASKAFTYSSKNEPGDTGRSINAMRQLIREKKNFQ